MAGQMGSGKDTSADHLVKHHGFTKLAFADNLKEMAMSVFSLTREQCYGEKEKFEMFDTPIQLTEAHVDSILAWVVHRNLFAVSREQVVKICGLIGTTFLTPRHILQFLGTEILRECIREDYHTEVLIKLIRSQGLEKVVISDCRFPNEKEKVKEWGGKTIIVTGRNTTQNADASQKAHASETSLGDVSGYDYHIENTGTLEELYSKVDSIVGSLEQ
jgi:hypothetical protein